MRFSKINFKSKKVLKQCGTLLAIAYLFIVTAFSVSSSMLNKQANSTAYEPQYTPVKVEASNKIIVSNDSSDYEEKLIANNMNFNKLGDSIYIIEDVSKEKISSLSDNSATISVIQTDVPFIISTDNVEETDKVSETTVENREETLPEGYTWKQLAQERGQKLVAVIDTGINNYAIHSENFTGSGTEDKNGHGTFIAQAINSNSNGSAMILSLKAMNDDGIGYMSSVMQALQYAREQNVDIINMSIVTDAGEGIEAFVQLIKDTLNDGIKIVAAAGNYQSDVKNYLPAGIDGVISVGAVDENGHKTGLSNYGDVTYYEYAGSTSEASAIITGKLTAGGNLSSNITKDNVVIDEGTVVEDPVKIAEEDEADPGFVIARADQVYTVDFQGTNGHGYILISHGYNTAGES